MTGLRCNVCDAEMEVVRSTRVFGFSWRCPSEGFLRHFEKERAASCYVEAE